MTTSSLIQEDIAIVGMSCMFPGADSLASFWHNIVHQVSCISDAPSDWQPELFFDPTGTDPGRSYCKAGGFLGDLCRFDPARYGVPPTSIRGAEPDHYIALRCAFEALADAGVPDLPLNRDKTGVVVGRGLFVNRGWISAVQHTFAVDEVIRVLRQLEPERSDEQFDRLKADLKRHLPPMDAETVPGLVHSALVGRIANRLDLRGPAYTVDAACSSVMIALEQGMRELRCGTCDAVLIGGSQVSTPAQIYVIFCLLQALSRKNKIAPFSAEAAGTLIGQGCGMLLLKRRSDAERDGNRVYALIKSVGISSDGRRAGILAPNSLGQQLAINRAYEQANISPATVQLIEAHGTGIPLGDRTELQSLSNCFAAGQAEIGTVALGSVKSMIGHLLPAAASASLIKTALALYHRVLPPTINADEPHPDLEITKTPFYLCNVPRPWLHANLDAPRRAGVNAFGFGGINAHAILEEHPVVDESALPRFEQHWPAELIVVSADSRPALAARVESLSTWVRRCESVNLKDIGAACARREGANRLSIVATSREDLLKKLQHVSQLLADASRAQIQDRSGIYWYAQPLGVAGTVAFLFPGEGAQYVNMMDDLCRHFPEVRREFDLTAAALQARGATQPLGRLLYPQPQQATKTNAVLFQLEGAVASVTAASRGLLALLRRLDVRPDAIVGHSSGEFGALLAAGVFRPRSEAEAIESIIAGAASASQLVASGLVPRGKLLAVGGADPDAVRRIVNASGGRLSIAMDNCPHQVVIAGDDESIDAAMNGLRGQGGLCEVLAWDRAYHTEAFAPVCGLIDTFYDGLTLQAPHTTLWSCATCARYPSDPAAIQELAVRQWRTPVRFRETILAMHGEGVRMFAEVGPRGNLSSFVSDTLAGLPHAAIALDVPRKSGIEQLCRAVGMLVAHGVPVNLAKLFERREPASVDLDSNLPPARPPQPRLPLELPILQVSDSEREAYRARGPQRDASPPHSSDRCLCEPAATHTKDALPADSRRPAPVSPAAPPAGMAPVLENSARQGLRDVSRRPVPASPPLAVPPITPSPRRLSKEITARHDSAPLPDASLCARAFADFEQTMREFLKLQQHAAQLRGPAAHPPDRQPARPAEGWMRAVHRAAPPGGCECSLTHAAVSSNRTPAVAAPSWPFLQEIVKHEPGVRLVAECVLETQRHRFLSDHTFFGRGLSVTDSDVIALPIMPLAMTLEMLAEVAAALRPELLVIAVSDIVTFRWLALDSPSRRVRLEAVADGHLRTRVSVTEADRGDHSGRIAEAIIEHASEPQSLGPPRFSDVVEPPPPWKSNELYGPILYHGAAFQGIEEVERCGPGGIQARVRVPDPGLLFADGLQKLVLPAVLIDTASQIPALANVGRRFDEGIATLAFPNTTARMEFIPGRPVQEPLVASVRLNQDERYLRSDVELKAQDGTVVLRYLGRVEEVVPFPVSLYVYPVDPRRRGCTADITRLFEGVPGIDRCRVTDATPLADKVFVNQHWSEVLARMVLSRQERADWYALRTPPVARANWLIARVAAKDAVRYLTGAGLCLADVVIQSDERGRPLVITGAPASVCVSMAHKTLFAVGVAASGVRGVGIDIEPVGELDPRVVDDAFDAQERRMIESAGAAFAAAWTAKEAVGKAVGLGLLGGPRSVKLTDVRCAPEGLYFAGTPTGQLAAELSRSPERTSRPPQLAAYTRTFADHYVTLSLLRDESE